MTTVNFNFYSNSSSSITFNYFNDWSRKKENDEFYLHSSTHRDNVDEDIREYCEKYQRFYPKLTPETFESFYQAFWNFYFHLDGCVGYEIFTTMVLAMNFVDENSQQPYDEFLSVSDHSFWHKSSFFTQKFTLYKPENPIHNLFRGSTLQERFRDTTFYAYTLIRNAKGCENAVLTRYVPLSWNFDTAGGEQTIAQLYLSIYSIQPKLQWPPNHNFVRHIKNALLKSYWLSDILWPTINSEKIRASKVANYTLLKPFAYHGLDMITLFNKAKTTLRNYNPNVKLLELVPFRSPVVKQRLEFLETYENEMKNLAFYGAIDRDSTAWFTGESQSFLMGILTEIAYYDHPEQLDAAWRNDNVLQEVTPSNQDYIRDIVFDIIDFSKASFEYRQYLNNFSSF